MDLLRDVIVILPEPDWQIDINLLSKRIVIEFDAKN